MDLLPILIHQPLHEENEQQIKFFFSNFTFCACEFASPYQQLKTSLTKWLSFVKGNALGKGCS